MKKVYVRSNGKIGVSTVYDDPSMTDQSQKDDCDVNVIMKRILRTGQMPPVSSRSGVYGDFTELGSFQDAMNTVVKAQDAFMDLPSDVRGRFQNDPQQLINYLNDPKNMEESYKLGLRVKVEPKVDQQLEATKGLTKAMTEFGDKVKGKFTKKSEED